MSLNYFSHTLLLIFFLFLNQLSKANHIMGGDLTYRHISGFTYEINLTLYGQCGAQGNAFDSLPVSHPEIKIKKSGVTQPSSIFLDVIPGSFAEITPVCNAFLNSTNCNILNSTIPGVKRIKFSKTITLSGADNLWEFIFEGNLGGTYAGRSSTITNVNNAGNQLMYLVAMLNNQSGSNSSPIFTTVPTPFFCANSKQNFNQGAVDSDNDSLKFELTPALQNGTSVSYVSGFDATYPLNTTDGNFNLNSINGQMSFIPSGAQNALVVNRVLEYRNGVLIGSVIREMTFIILNNCNNIPAKDTIENLINSVLSPNKTINVCEGTNNISFQSFFSDGNGDSISVSYAGIPAGANINIANNNTANPTLTFNWNTSTVPKGFYTFYLTLKESNCPINNQQTISYTIRIVQKNNIDYSIISPTNCFKKAVIKIETSEGITPRTIAVNNGSGIVKTIIDSTGVVIDSLPVGNYTLSVSSPFLPCLTNSIPLSIVDSGIYPFTPQLTESPIYCIENKSIQLAVVPQTGAVVKWYSSAGTPLNSAPSINLAAPNVYYFLINQKMGNCTSKLDTVKVVVSDFPTVVVTNKTEVACVGDKILLTATGASQYIWLPENEISYNNNNQPYIQVFQPSNFQVIGINQYGCRDTVDFKFSNIQNCCTFSYPTAFTPNNDQKNDTWCPIMYGNEVSYELIIMNRWGAVVFKSNLPNQAWDGSFNGMPQEIGTYFYYLKAKCIAGPEETAKGDFILLR